MEHELPAFAHLRIPVETCQRQSISCGLESKKIEYSNEASTDAPNHSLYSRPSVTTGANLPWKSQQDSSGSSRTFASVNRQPTITLYNGSNDAPPKVVCRVEKDVNLKTTLPKTPFDSPFAETAAHFFADEVPAEGSENPEPQGSASMNASVTSANGNRKHASQQVVTTFSNFKNQGVCVSPSSQPMRSRNSYIQQRSALSLNAAPHLITVNRGNGPVSISDSRANLTPGLPSKSMPALTLQKFPRKSDIAHQTSRTKIVSPASIEESHLIFANSLKSEDTAVPNQAAVKIEPNLPRKRSIPRSHSSSTLDQRKSCMTNQSEEIQAIDSIHPNTSSNSGELTESERRSVRRRLTNRASASRMAEKRGMEMNAMEELVEKLEEEHKELKSHCSRDKETCTELKQKVETLASLLQTQEADNTQLKTELDYLRKNCALLPPFVGNSDLMASPVVSASQIYTPANHNDNFLYTPGMPTEEQIAADLELDWQLIANRNTTLDFNQNWHLWQA